MIKQVFNGSFVSMSLFIYYCIRQMFSCGNHPDDHRLFPKTITNTITSMNPSQIDKETDEKPIEEPTKKPIEKLIEKYGN